MNDGELTQKRWNYGSIVTGRIERLKISDIRI